MRKVLIILLCIPLIIFNSSCSQKQENTELKETVSTNADLSKYIQSVDLPDNLSISLDASSVKILKSAKAYSTNFIDVDADTAIEKLLHGEIAETHLYAVGPQYVTNGSKQKEYLTVFDGGKSFGTDSGVVGGLSYLVYLNNISDIEKFSSVISSSIGPPDIEEQLYGYGLKGDYASYAELDFSSYKNSLSTTEELLYSAGIPELEVAETYSLDLETMQEHYKKYTDAQSYIGTEEIEAYTYGKSDEAYLFIFRQVIDSIPVINVLWNGMGSSTSAEGNPMPATVITAYYTENGVSDIYAVNLYAVPKNGEEKALISADSAMQKIIDSYSGVILEQATSIISMELCYVGIPSGDNYELIPAWVFCLSEANDWDNGDGTTTKYNTYEYFVINAVTGEKISY